MNKAGSAILNELPDIEVIRRDFPILATTVNGYPLVYLDNGATTQKPLQVINAIQDYYSRYNANVHRGVHHLSQVATEAYEQTRHTVAEYINADVREVVFTKGTTDSINLVASCFRRFVNEGDSIMISAMEHHSNIVPWQLLCEERKATLKVIPMNELGELDMAAFKRMLDDKVKLLSVVYVSNALGTVNPVKEIVQLAHEHGIPVLIDAAQAVQHIPIDVKELDVDFLAFSGHKIYGPTGTGILYGKLSWLEKLPPYQGGGDMIKEVSFEKTTYNDPPLKFEAGTPNIEGIVGLGAAISYINSIGLSNIAYMEQELLNYALNEMAGVEELRFIGQAHHRSSAISFLVGKHHPFDVGTILDQLGIAVRTGHHCTQPVMACFGIPGTVRASLAFYNTREEVDKLAAGIRKAVKLLG